MTSSILQQVAANSQAAMDECLERYGGLVWSLVQRRCNNRADAEDLVQDIFLDVWKSAHRYDPTVAEESTFIAMISRRRLIDRSRRQQRAIDMAALPDSLEPTSPGSPPIEINDEAAHVRKMMNQLGTEERRVIELAIDHGLSQSQISETTKLPLGTVKSHARRGMLRLRSMLRVGEQPLKGGAR